MCCIVGRFNTLGLPAVVSHLFDQIEVTLCLMCCTTCFLVFVYVFIREPNTLIIHLLYKLPF